MTVQEQSDMYQAISSMQNPRIKSLKRLMEKSKARKEEGVFVIDGWKEILMAKNAGYVIQKLFVRDGSLYREQIREEWGSEEPEAVLVFKSVFDKLSYRGASSTAIAIAQQPGHQLGKIELGRSNPLVMIVDAVEKPGNLGALIRTADACAVDAVICCDVATDIYNPNIIRSSVGCVFSVPIALAGIDATLDWLKQHRIKVFTTSLQASIPYHQADYTVASAIVLGTEAIGVDPVWEQESDQNVVLPMLGKNDSLNVSNAAAVILYEVLRQRGFK